MEKNISIDKAMMAMFLASAVLGYVVGIGKLYFFHIISLVCVFCMFLGYIKVTRYALKSIFPLFLLIIFAVFSLLWAPNIKTGSYIIFYLINGCFIVFSIVNFSERLEKLDFAFKVLAVFYSLNFFVGLVETTGLFRLPVSPYYGLNDTRPSGFNSNLNNFGFVFLAVFPFLFLYRNNLVKLLAIVLAIWFAFKLESKGFFLGFILFFLLLVLIEIKNIRAWRWIFGLSISALLLSVIVGLMIEDLNLNNRIFSTFNQIGRGIELIKNNTLTQQDSTGFRAYMYGYGIQELIKSYGLGLGVAGVGSKLAVDAAFLGLEKDFFSFHNFFLEMLIDFGVIPFTLLILGYLILINQLISISKKVKNQQLKYYTKASALSLLLILPASISPSSIIYIFTFWLIIGFSLASLRLARKCS